MATSNHNTRSLTLGSSQPDTHFYRPQTTHDGKKKRGDPEKERKRRAKYAAAHPGPTFEGFQRKVWPRLNVGQNLCWLWTAFITPGGSAKGGYAKWQIDAKTYLVHRYVFELFKGKIPAGLTLDHLCRNRHCCNPSHLEIATVKENNLRGCSPPAINASKTHCPQGHPYSGENLFISGGHQGRQCRICHRIRTRKGKAKLRQRRLAEKQLGEKQ